jgi:hypothetical protein
VKTTRLSSTCSAGSNLAESRSAACPRGKMPPAVKRRLATLAAVASLVLCVATIVLWVRSHTYLESFSLGYCSVATANDTMWLGVYTRRQGFYYHADPAVWADPRNEPPWRFDRGRDWYMYSVPVWLPAAIFFTLALVCARRALRRPVARGICPACGYDLRATPDRCPECGAAPAALAAR